MTRSISRFKLGLLLGATACALAQNPGAFTPTGSMITARAFHTATLLPDGRVLIAGGTNGSAPVLTAELYDPSTGAFTGIPWNGGTPLFLLPDARVFVLGPGNSTSAASIYDPSSGAFTAAVPWNTGLSVTLISDGRILALEPGGGLEFYDPSTGTFAMAGTIPWRDWTSTVTPLVDGAVLFTRNENDGACGRTPIPYSLALLYDPSTHKFAETANNVITNHAGPTATLLTNGKVLIAGGDLCDGDGGSPHAELYDPATQTFSATGDMAVGRESHTATLLPDGSVLVTGGNICCTDLQLQASAELYDPVAGAFQSAGYMTTGRAQHTATLLMDGRVLITGGYRIMFPTGNGIGRSNAVLSTAEIYTPTNPVPAAELLSLSGDGTGQGAIQHAGSYQLVSADNPATAGEAIVVYCTGLINGSVMPPQVSIGGRVAQVLWFGNTPGFPGLNQINVLVPSEAAPGTSVSVRMNYMGRTSNAVTLGLQ